MGVFINVHYLINIDPYHHPMLLIITGVVVAVINGSVAVVILGPG